MRRYLLPVAVCGALSMLPLHIHADSPPKPKGSGIPGKSESTSEERPATKPGWVIVEEDIWFPLRYSLHDFMDRARERFRHHEQKGAANEIRKAIAMLKIAEGQATPDGVKTLQETTHTLQSLAQDLDQNKVSSARELDHAVRKAYFALATHHYLKANSASAQKEMKRAGEHLQTAANYLTNAMHSAEHEFGKNVIVEIEKIDEHGRILSEERTLEPNVLEKDLEKLHHELESLGKVIQNSAK